MKFSFETINDDNKQTYKRCSETIGSWELEAGAVVLILNPITDIPQSRLFASTGWQRGREGIIFFKKNGIPAQLVPNWVFMTRSCRIELLLHCRPSSFTAPEGDWGGVGQIYSTQNWDGADILNTKLHPQNSISPTKHLLENREMQTWTTESEYHHNHVIQCPSPCVLSWIEYNSNIVLYTIKPSAHTYSYPGSGGMLEKSDEVFFLFAEIPSKWPASRISHSRCSFHGRFPISMPPAVHPCRTWRPPLR